MRVLAVSTWFPYPPNNGSRARTYHLLRHVGEKHELDLLALTQSNTDREHIPAIEAFCRTVQVFPEPVFQPSSLVSMPGFLSVTPRYFTAHHSSELAAALRRMLAGRSYDVAIAVSLGSAPYIADLDGPHRLLDEHNVECRVLKRQMQEAGSMARRLRMALTWMKAERYERRLAGKHHVVTVVSDQEREHMADLLGSRRTARVSVIPNGVAPELLGFPGQASREDVLLYTGALSYSPNYDAALRLCREVLPKVQKQVPTAKVRVTGSFDGVDLAPLRAPGVEFTGYVTDIRPLVASACALVVPMRLGGGTRVKILESMALGTPVVSTAMGAEGLRVTDKENILIANSSEEIADYAVALINSPKLRARLSSNARELVRETYQWPAIAADFEREVAGDVQCT